MRTPAGFFFVGRILKYTKPAIPVEKQVELLIARGMKVADPAKAAFYLAHINYYRLRAYWLQFEVPADKPGAHKLREGTTFESVISLYDFDRKLRMIVLDAIERIEVSVRTRFAYTLSLKYGSHAQLEAKIFDDMDKYQEDLDDLQAEIERSHETFIKHYLSTYDDPMEPPVWAITEVMSLGVLSKFYSNIKLNADRNEIAKIYEINEGVLRSFLHHLTHVRNICAHHSRLWNRRFVLTPVIPLRPDVLAKSMNQKADRNIHNTLVMAGYLLRKISPDSTWTERLKELLASFDGADKASMGFPENWEKKATALEVVLYGFSCLRRLALSWQITGPCGSRGRRGGDSRHG